MPTLSFHDKQHVNRLLNQQGQVKRIFDDFVRRSGLLLTNWTEKSIDNVWIRNAVLEKQIDKLLEDLHDNLMKNISSTVIASWNASHDKNDDLIGDYIKDLALSEIVGKSQFEELEKGMFARNMEALKAFQERKTNGLTLSDTVWNTVNGAKDNLEYYLSSGISTGRPAATIASDIRQLLNNPDKRFRRVRNEAGKLVLSKPMAEYHPGQGTYRSSYKNALRVAATETNMAYHTADYERWQNLDFVLGYDISRSRSNRGPCPTCDPMVGRYPKSFKFIGFHPWCICVCVPVMLEGEEYIDYLLSGKVPKGKVIRTIPDSARKLVESSNTFKRSYIIKQNENIFKATVAPKAEVVRVNSLAEAKDAMANLSVSEKHRNAIMEYTGGKYNQINSYLRGQRQSVPDDVKETISNLDDFLSKAPKVSTTSYRGLTLSESEFLDFKNLEKGGMFADKAFISTSYDQTIANQFSGNAQYQVEMTIKGKNGVLIEKFSDAGNENEIIFERNSKFNIDSIKVKEKKGIMGKITLVLSEL